MGVIDGSDYLNEPNIVQLLDAMCAAHDNAERRMKEGRE